MAASEDDFKDFDAALAEQKAELKVTKSQQGQKPSPSMKLSRAQLGKMFTELALGNKTLSKSQLQKFMNCMMSEAYLPCTLPLSDLAPIHLHNLTLETHHRGRVLIVKTIGEPFNLALVENAIEDELGCVDRLAIDNLLPGVAPNSVLPKGIVVAVKEPYYKRVDDGFLLVRVDHPSDVIVLKPGNKLIPPALAPRVTDMNPSALGLKADGNAAFAKGNWKLAIDLYSDALEAHDVADHDGLRRDLHRNRAGAHLRLGHFDLTIADAMAAIIPEANSSYASGAANAKAFYRAGKAAYALGDFRQAEEYFEQGVLEDTSRLEIGLELERAIARVTEQETGRFYFSAMAKSVKEGHMVLDHASFLKHVEVRPAGKRGRGLFATKAMAPGDVVFVEKAFHVFRPEGGEKTLMFMNLSTDRVSFTGDAIRLRGIVDKVLWNPTLAAKYFDLYDGGKFKTNGNKVAVIGGKVAVDVFQTQAIAEMNATGCPGMILSDDFQSVFADTSDRSTGIWLRASYANHSCLPDVMGAAFGDVMIFRAQHPIQPGQEIFMSYNTPFQSFAKRQMRMQKLYGFKCDCVLCTAEAQVSPSLVQQRDNLVSQIDAFLSAHSLPAVVKPSFFTADLRVRAKTLLDKIRATYPAKLFQQLPRLHCVGISVWVAMSSMIEGPETVVARSLETLRDSGYFITIQADQVKVNSEHAYPTEQAAHAAMSASQTLGAMRKKKIASVLESLSQTIFAAFTGFHDGEEKASPKGH